MATCLVDEVGERGPVRGPVVSNGVADNAGDGCGRPRPNHAALSSEVLEAVICQGAANLTAAEAEWLLAVAEFDRRRAWEGWGITSCAHWLAWQVGLDLRAAREKVRVAAALTVFGRIRAEMAAGHLSYTKVRAITRVATFRNEADLVTLALAGNTAQVERLVAGMRRAVADGDDPNAAEDALDKRAWERRGMTYTTDEQQRMMTITVRLPYVEGAELMSAIEGFAEAAEPMDPTDAARDPHAARRADAAVAMARLAHAAREAGLMETDPDDHRPGLHPDGGDVPDSQRDDDGRETDDRGRRCAAACRAVGSGRPLVSVSVDLDTILDVPCGRHDPSDAGPRSPQPEGVPAIDWATLGAGVTEVDAPGLREPLPISRATALRMLCDCDVEAIVTRDGTAVGISERGAIVRGRQRRLVLRRDEHRCRWPGCGRRGRLQIHHIRHRAHRGGNELRNLLTVCPSHHRQVHEGGWQIRTDADGLLEFVGPTGQVVSSAEPAHDGHSAAVQAQGRSAADGRSKWEGDRLDLSLAVGLLLWHDSPLGVAAHLRRGAAADGGDSAASPLSSAVNSDFPGSADGRSDLSGDADSLGSAGGWSDLSGDADSLGSAERSVLDARHGGRWEARARPARWWPPS